jgi:hypothetical protein
LFVHSFHPFNWRNIVYIDPHNTLNTTTIAVQDACQQHLWGQILSFDLFLASTRDAIRLIVE